MAALCCCGFLLSPVLADEPPFASLQPWAAVSPAELELDALDAGKVTLEHYRDQSIIVHFFATWCEPCVSEMAALDRLAADSAAGEMVILAVDVGEIDARVRRFIQENPVPFPVLLDRDRAATRSWQVAGLPASYVLAPGLAPVLHAQGEVDWDAPSTRAALLAATGPSTQDFMSQNEGGTWR